MITLRGSGTTLDAVERVARGREPVAVDAAVRERVAAAFAVVQEAAASGTPVYGLTTALGANTGAPVLSDDIEAYQRRAILARAVGTGQPFPIDVVRAIAFARLSGMAAGGSGASPALVDSLAAMLNAAVHPVVPCRGSVSAGDLAPLSHLGLTLLGLGEAERDGEVLSAGEALLRAGITPLSPRGRDGLALISANAATLGYGALVLRDATRSLDRANVAAALAFEGFRANVASLDARVHATLGWPPQVRIAERVRELLEGGALLVRGAARRLQDPLSLRCLPQVHATALDTLQAACTTVERHLNRATESPLVLRDEAELVSNGNFDSTEIALRFEALGLALAHVGALAMQRCQRLCSPPTSGLPLQLTRHGPAHSGFATVQKTLSALVAELKALAQPMTLHGLPVSEAIEDHASLALECVGKTARMLPLLDQVAAIELLCAAQAVDLRPTPEADLGAGTRAAYAVVRALVPMLEHDRPLGPEIDRLAAALSSSIRTVDLLA